MACNMLAACGKYLLTRCRVEVFNSVEC